MATKAERFKARVERSGPKKEKSPPKPRRDDPVDTSQPGVSATDRKAGGGDSAKRNASKRAARKGGPVLESSAGKPSRKSTRKAKGGAKRTTNLKLRAERAVAAPTARARRSKAKTATKKTAKPRLKAKARPRATKKKG